MAKAKKKVRKLNRIDRKEFETYITANAKDIERILDDYKHGIIRDNDYLFTLEDVKIICYRVFVGGWANCQMMENPVGKWANEQSSTQGREIIKEAFS